MVETYITMRQVDTRATIISGLTFREPIHAAEIPWMVFRLSIIT